MSLQEKTGSLYKPNIWWLGSSDSNITALKTQHELVVTSLHWTIVCQHSPSLHQKELYCAKRKLYLVQVQKFHLLFWTWARSRRSNVKRLTVPWSDVVKFDGTIWGTICSLLAHSSDISIGHDVSARGIMLILHIFEGNNNDKLYILV